MAKSEGEGEEEGYEEYLRQRRMPQQRPRERQKRMPGRKLRRKQKRMPGRRKVLIRQAKKH